MEREKKKALLYAFPHPNEPIGSMSLEFLSSFLADNPKFTKKIGYTIGEEALKLAISIPEDEYFTHMDIEVYRRRILIPQKDAKYFSKVWFLNSVKWWIKKFFLFKIAKFDKISVNFPFFKVERKHLKNFGSTIVQYIKLKASNDKIYGIITIPGELFEEIGKILIKEAPSSEENTLIFQNAQDWIGYLFPLEMYINEGGYEPFMCFSPLGGAYIEFGTKKLLNDVKNKIE